MKNLIIAFLLVGALTIHSKVLYSNEVDEIIVISSYIDTNLSDLDDPIHVIAGDDVIFDSTLSLGESLDNLLGVQSSDFGSGVGHPVIRGLSGSRVKKMNNGRTLRDVSSVGDDHMNEVDLNDIQQIEIVRGPSSLLYSSGTVGGIINIIDNTIDNLSRLDVKFTAKDIRKFLFSTRFIFQNLDISLIYSGDL